MKDPKQWLTDRATPPGMMACGLRLPDGNFFCRSLDETCPAAKLERLLGRAPIFLAAVATEGIAPRWCSWTFEQGIVRFVERPDGWLLALVARPDSDAVARLDPLAQEFLTLPLGDV